MKRGFIMGYISTIKSTKTGVCKYKVFWREDLPNGKVIRHSKTLPANATEQEALEYLHKSEAKTFRKTKYSDTGYITTTATKDGTRRFVVHWNENTPDGKVISRQQTLAASMTKNDALRILSRKEQRFKSQIKRRKGVF